MNGGAQEEQYFYFEGEPTDAEVDWFARKMGMHLVRDKDFLYLAREGLMNPPPDGWETVKSQTGSIHWVNSDHTELMDDPPHLAELTENFKKVKKKAQMLANRGEDEKMNARKKLLGRNLPDSMLNNDSNPPPNPRGGGYDEKSLKKSGPGTSDLMKEMKGNPTANNRGGLNATPNQKGQTDLFNGRESTDPRAKQARLEESEGEAFSIGEAYDDDVPYNYTKSTVKKRGETGSTPKSHATGADPKRAGASGAILYRDEEEGSPLDEFITPSGKKEPPRANRGGQAAQPNYSQMGQQSQMIDSAVLEKMIQEINTMQMRVSEIEQQNANLKKQNQELVKGQRSLQVQTNKEIQAARRELEETIKEKEDQISKTLKGELEKKLDEDKSKFTLLQEMKDIKAIFQKSLVMRADNTPNLSAGTDLQKALPLADSVVIPNGQVPSQNMFHQSFGAEAAPEAVTEAVKPSSQYLGQGQQPSQVAPQTVPEAVPIQQKAPPVVQSPPVVGAPPVVVNTHPKLSPAVISSYEGKWLGILLKEKGLLAKVTASITQLAKRIKQRKKHLLKHESDMNLEVSRLSLTPEHPLVLRIRDFLKMQNKDLKKDKNSLRREEDNYRRRAEGIATLEQFLTFAQGTGSFTPEIDKQLEEVYFRFKDTPLSGLNASFMEDDEESSLHSERRITQQGSSMTLEAGENLDPKPEDKPKSEEKPAEDSTPEGAQVPVVVTEGQNPPVLRTRKSSHQSKGSPTLKGTYFNEIGGRRAAKSIDKWPDVSRDHKLFSKTTDFLNEQWYQSKMRDSLAYRPSALRWEDFTNSSSTYMKRYFQTQSRWYTDIRREVCLLLSRSKSSSGELCLPVECTNR